MQRTEIATSFADKQELRGVFQQQISNIVKTISASYQQWGLVGAKAVQGLILGLVEHVLHYF